MVNVLCNEGLATHIGPEQCVCICKDAGEASAGVFRFTELHQRIQNNRYRPQPSRRVYIAKAAAGDRLTGRQNRPRGGHLADAGQHQQMGIPTAIETSESVRVMTLECCI